MTIDELIEKIRNNDLNTFPSALEAYLKAPGHSVNDKDSGGNILIVQAASYNRFTIVQLLLEKKVDINSTNKYGVTALISASHAHYIEIIDLLLEHNADPNIEDKTQKTALGWVVKKNDTTLPGIISAMQLLINSKADMNAFGKNHPNANATILDHVMVSDIQPVAEYLISQGAIVSSSTIKKLQILSFDAPKRTLTPLSLYQILEKTTRLISIEPYEACTIALMRSVAKLSQETTPQIISHIVNEGTNGIHSLLMQDKDTGRYLHLEEYLDYYDHNQTIKGTIEESAFQLGFKTPLLNKLSHIIGEYLSRDPELTRSFPTHFKKGRTLRFTAPVVNLTNNPKPETVPSYTPLSPSHSC